MEAHAHDRRVIEALVAGIIEVECAGMPYSIDVIEAGLKCLLLEKRFEVGGGLATEQVTLPDFFPMPGPCRWHACLIRPCSGACSGAAPRR